MPTQKKEKPIGKVTHYYGHISVAIVKFNTAVKKGTKVAFRRGDEEFIETLDSMQFEHKDISSVKKGQEVGIKVNEKIKEGFEVFLVKE
jgi:translation initiation factor IF-2